MPIGEPDQPTNYPGGIKPDATSFKLGWTGLQAFRYHNLSTSEVCVPPLSHHVLALVTKPPGKMHLRYSGVKREKPPPVGSIAVIPAGSAIEWAWRDQKDSTHIYLEPALICRVAEDSLDLHLPGGEIPPLDAVTVPELRTMILALDYELRTAGIGGNLLIESYANILSIYLLRHAFGLRPAKIRKTSALSRRKLNTVIDYIMENLSGAPTLQQMAALVHLSPYHFTREFKAASGLAPHQFLITRRVELAQRLLSERESSSLTEIATAVGFSDQSQLTFHFKRIVGVTPGEYRRAARSL
jgi:AraC family transcriptional regulator